MRERESSSEEGRATSGWSWQRIVLSGVTVLAALAVTARELPAIRRYLRMKSM